MHYILSALGFTTHAMLSSYAAYYSRLVRLRWMTEKNLFR